MPEIRSKYYRVSIKALVLNETADKFLVMKQGNDVWDLPGGGLEWGELPKQCLEREIKEEMNVSVLSVADEPEYFIGGHPMTKEGDVWTVNIVYRVELSTLDFKASDECLEVRFVSLDELENLERVPPTVIELARKLKK